jgi:hypothetical protein
VNDDDDGEVIIQMAEDKLHQVKVLRKKKTQAKSQDQADKIQHQIDQLLKEIEEGKRKSKEPTTKEQKK